MSFWCCFGDQAGSVLMALMSYVLWEVLPYLGMFLAKIWMGMGCVVAVLQVPIFLYRMLAAKPGRDDEDRSIAINQRWTSPGERGWFTLSDLTYRYGLVLLAFEWNLIT